MFPGVNRRGGRLARSARCRAGSSGPNPSANPVGGLGEEPHMKRLSHGRHLQSGSRGPLGRTRPDQAWGRLALLAGTAALSGTSPPPGVAGPAPVSSPSLPQLVALANGPTTEIDNLGQQYDLPM